MHLSNRLNEFLRAANNHSHSQLWVIHTKTWNLYLLYNLYSFSATDPQLIVTLQAIFPLCTSSGIVFFLLFVCLFVFSSFAFSNYLYHFATREEENIISIIRITEAEWLRI